MRISKEHLLLYAVTDRAWTGQQTLEDQVESAIAGGITCVQLREKILNHGDFLEEAKKIQGICKAHAIPFIINDNVDIAIETQADGLHIGQDDGNVADIRQRIGENIALGVSVHTVDEARNAVAEGADYLGVGAVRATDTKSEASVVSLQTMREICDAVPVPVVAIGGIHLDNLTQLRGLGLAGVALVSEIFAAQNIKEHAALLREKTEAIFWKHKLPIALTIAGSDSGGGAGIQADLKTMTARGVFGTSCVTAITAQNTMGVTAIHPIPTDIVQAQLDALWDDLKPQALKLGMLAQVSLIETIGAHLKKHPDVFVVCDPVMVATSGASLIEDDAKEALQRHIFPVSDVITPNIPEAEAITGLRIETPADMEKAGQMIFDSYGCAVLIKGGHQKNDANDCLVSEEGVHWFYGARIANKNTHGTGCTLSAAIAAEVAKGVSLIDAITNAKAYLSMILSAQLDLGRGSGPMDHAYFCGRM